MNEGRSVTSVSMTLPQSSFSYADEPWFLGPDNLFSVGVSNEGSKRSETIQFDFIFPVDNLSTCKDDSVIRMIRCQFVDFL